MNNWQLAYPLKALLITLLFVLTGVATAQNAVPKNYKGDVSTGEKFYKGVVASPPDTANYVPREAKYGGQVYTSDLYQGPIEDSGYSPSEPRSLHDGFYMGAEIGYDSYNMSTKINTTIGGVSVFQQTPDLNAVGLSYTALAGYGRVFDDPLYLGAELFYNSSQATTSQNVVGIYNIKSLVLNSYGASFLPGIKLGTSTLLFLKAGYTRVDAKTYETSSSLGVNNAQPNGVNGIHYGLGFESTIYQNWSARGEYTHINCKSFTTSVGTKITPSDNQFMFGVILHFI